MSNTQSIVIVANAFGYMVLPGEFVMEHSTLSILGITIPQKLDIPPASRTKSHVRPS